MLQFTIPVRTCTEGNAKEHWRTKHKRAKEQRAMAAAYGRDHSSGFDALLLPEPPCTVTLTRVSTGTLDDDNLVGSLKHVRDGIADWLGVDDKHRDIVRYAYRQRKGKPMTVEVTVTPGIAD